MGYHCVVLVKQVPDTKCISGKVMNDDGTVNRAALPAIFNPEDLNALEMALAIKDRFDGKVTAITMGLPAAAETLRQSLFRGADEAILVTDPKCAASDTLATSYILSCAVKKLDYDLVLCGRQAIDGDTAQVGPQLAEKLGLTQISYCEELLDLTGQEIQVRRNLGNGWQRVKAQLPVLLTVLDQANTPRVGAAKKMMKHKNAQAPCEIAKQIKAENPQANEKEIKELVDARIKHLESKGSLIKEWNLDILGADLTWCGRNGSPTKVHRIQSVVLAGQETKEIEPTEAGISAFIHELIEDKIIA